MEKNLDSKGRWRNKIVAFRVSPEEAEQIDACVRLSGLSKQDYITKRLTDRKIVVQEIQVCIRHCEIRWQKFMKN